MNQEEIRAQLTRLHMALLCDVMDSLGFRDSAFGMSIRPMEPSQKLVGTAFTIRCEAVDQLPEKAFSAAAGCIRRPGKGDVIVLHCGEQVSAMWGELLSTAAIAKGAVGAVMGGATRDVEQILQMDFPLVSTGFSPLDSAGRKRLLSMAAQCVAGTPMSGPVTGSWATSWAWW
jgi:4-hydroxy-4-methyl-2-oxoglutarate aldolase